MPLEVIIWVELIRGSGLTIDDLDCGLYEIAGVGRRSIDTTGVVSIVPDPEIKGVI